MEFNYATNRIIAGICEYCGIKAIECEHYKNGQQKPLDEKDKLINPLYIPEKKSIYVEPLDTKEMAASVEEAKAVMEDMVKEIPEEVEVEVEVEVEEEVGEEIKEE